MIDVAESGIPVLTTLGALLESIDGLDGEATIYALPDRPLSSESGAVAAFEGSTIPEGLTYLLEVFLARDVIETWSIHRQGRVPDSEERVTAVVYYADRDAYLLPDE